MISVKCPHCQEEIQESNYNIKTKIAQCQNCDSLSKFDLKKALHADKSYKQVNKPDNIDVVSFSSGMQMILNYRNKIELIKSSVTTATVLIMILFFLYFSGVSNFNFYLPLLIPIILMSFALNQYYKKATIRIKDERLTITTKSPIPIGNSHWTNQTKTIKQLFVKKRIIKSEDSSTTYYDLGIEVQNNKIHFPIKNFKTFQELYYIEAELEKLLGIEDVHHPQEMKNSSLAPQNFKEGIMLAKELYRSYKADKKS